MKYFHLFLIIGSSQSFAHPQDLFQAIASNLGGRLNGDRSINTQRGVLDFANSLRNTIQNNPVIQNRLLANDLNPCNGERPQYCQLRDGTTVQFNLNVADNGDVPEFCVCPNGNRFKPESVVFSAIDKYEIPSCGKQEPKYCTCEDGTKFELVTVQLVKAGEKPVEVPQKCGGGLPRSCTCPDGKVIDRNQVIPRVVPLIQDLLG